MTSGWLSQILAVVRLEIRKTFFAKRGLWIYLLAAMPLALFVAHSISVSYRAQSRAHLASRNEKPLTSQSLASVSPGMTRAEVIELLGKPPQSYSWDEEKQQEHGSSHLVVHESFTYSDGLNVLHIRLEDGKVTGTTLGQNETMGEDTIVFAGPDSSRLTCGREVSCRASRFHGDLCEQRGVAIRRLLLGF